MKRSPLKIKSDAHRKERIADAMIQDITCKGAKCMLCGGIWEMGGHHLIKRRFKRYRWNPENVVPLCGICHAHAHNYPDDFDRLLQKNKPALWAKWQEWKDKRNEVGLKEDIDMVIERLRRMQ